MSEPKPRLMSRSFCSGTRNWFFLGRSRQLLSSDVSDPHLLVVIAALTRIAFATAHQSLLSS